jgi:hypothetical protein
MIRLRQAGVWSPLAACRTTWGPYLEFGGTVARVMILGEDFKKGQYRFSQYPAPRISGILTHIDVSSDSVERIWKNRPCN